MYKKAEVVRVELNGGQCMCCRLIGMFQTMDWPELKNGSGTPRGRTLCTTSLRSSALS